MIRIEDIKAGALLQGLELSEVVRIVTCEAIGPNAPTVYYKTNYGAAEGLIKYAKLTPLFGCAHFSRKRSTYDAFKQLDIFENPKSKALPTINVKKVKLPGTEPKPIMITTLDKLHAVALQRKQCG